jgi:hypothetical protein
MTVAAAAAMVHKQKKIVGAFREAGATSADRAVTAASLAIHRGPAFRILRGHGVLREAGDDRLYLDESAWESLRSRRLRIALAILGAFLVAAAAALLLTVGK